MAIPTQCQLWQKEQVTNEDIQLSSHFEHLNTFEEDTHGVRRLLRCRECGQLYFYEFYEWVDWTGGDDSSISLLLPIQSEEEASKLANMATSELLQLSPHLRRDWPAEASKPMFRWIK